MTRRLFPLMHGVGTDAAPFLRRASTIVSAAKPRIPMTSDTSAAKSQLVISALIRNNRAQFQPNNSAFNSSEILHRTKESIANLLGVPKATVVLTASTTQANKIMVVGFGNVNPRAGEVVLAAKQSHIFIHEVGQPRVEIDPKNKITGKLTVEDLEKALKYQKILGKKVKSIHLDQPTNGDYFYTENEIKEITAFAHGQGIPVTMDCERLVNYLARSEKSYADFTTKCGVDAISFGWQKNGGPRSSCAIVLNSQYFENPHDLPRRSTALLRSLGNVTNNWVEISSGWQEMIENENYLITAKTADFLADRIVYVLKNFTFKDKAGGEEKVFLQNYPLTTNMIFARLPRDFVNIFNELTDQENLGHFKLSPDRYGITRIVTAYDLKNYEVEQFIYCLKKSYLNYCQKNNLELPFGFEKLTLPQTNDDKNELNEYFGLLAKTSEKIRTSQKSQSQINTKFSGNEAPVDPRILTRIIEESPFYHPPYGDDQITTRSKEIIREFFTGDKNTPLPIAFTTSKEQAMNAVAQFLVSTKYSQMMTSPGYFANDQRFDRPVKPLELSGEYLKQDKLDPKSIEAVLSVHNSKKGMHKPLVSAIFLKLVTKTGFIYTPKEIEEIAKTAHKYNLPLVLDFSFCSYSQEDMQKYKSLADVALIGFQDVGGPLGSAMVVLNSKYLPYPSQVWENQGDWRSYQQLRLNRSVKASGGKQSSSWTLACGFEEVLANNMALCRENAAIANAHLEKMMTSLLRMEINGKLLEIENHNPKNNIIAVKLPEEFLRSLNAKGYHLQNDESGFVRIRLFYHIQNSEVDKLITDLQKTCEEFKSPTKTPQGAEESRLQKNTELTK